MNKQLLNYFGYGTNRTLDMMAAIIGRKEIEGIYGKLLGFELCIQKIDDIPDKILQTAPFPSSPRKIISECFNNDFELYIIRPREKAITYGIIWKITQQEYELVRDWELLEFGMQEDVKAVAIDAKGKIINVITHGSLSSKMPMDRVVEGNDYEDYLVPKKDILEVAEKSRKEYLERISE